MSDAFEQPDYDDLPECEDEEERFIILPFWRYVGAIIALAFAVAFFYLLEWNKRRQRKSEKDEANGEVTRRYSQPEPAHEKVEATIVSGYVGIRSRASRTNLRQAGENGQEKNADEKGPKNDVDEFAKKRESEIRIQQESGGSVDETRITSVGKSEKARASFDVKMMRDNEEDAESRANDGISNVDGKEVNKNEDDERDGNSAFKKEQSRRNVDETERLSTRKPDKSETGVDLNRNKESEASSESGADGGVAKNDSAAATFAAAANDENALFEVTLNRINASEVSATNASRQSEQAKAAFSDKDLEVKKASEDHVTEICLEEKGFEKTDTPMTVPQAKEENVEVETELERAKSEDSISATSAEREAQKYAADLHDKDLSLEKPSEADIVEVALREKSIEKAEKSDVIPATGSQEESTDCDVQLEQKRDRFCEVVTHSPVSVDAEKFSAAFHDKDLSIEKLSDEDQAGTSLHEKLAEKDSAEFHDHEFLLKKQGGEENLAKEAIVPQAVLAKTSRDLIVEPAIRSEHLSDAIDTFANGVIEEIVTLDDGAILPAATGGQATSENQRMNLIGQQQSVEGDDAATEPPPDDESYASERELNSKASTPEREVEKLRDIQVDEKVPPQAAAAEMVPKIEPITAENGLIATQDNEKKETIAAAPERVEEKASLPPKSPETSRRKLETAAPPAFASASQSPKLTRAKALAEQEKSMVRRTSSVDEKSISLLETLGASSTTEAIKIMRSLTDLSDVMKLAGLEKCNLIFGIDYTASNKYQGEISFNHDSLHSIKEGRLNPYQEVVGILGKTLQPFATSPIGIPAYGFGDIKTSDWSVFPLNGELSHCKTFDELLQVYNRITPKIILSGPTNFAPLIMQAVDVCKRIKDYHILVIIADGQVTNERATRRAIVDACKYPLSIIVVGVGDGPWQMMKVFDESLPKRPWDNFHFIDFNEVKSRTSDSDIGFAVEALLEIPDQYKNIKKLGLLNFGNPSAD